MKLNQINLLSIILIFAFSVSGQTKRNKSQKTKTIPQIQKVIDYSAVYEDKWLRYGSSDDSAFYYNPAKAARKGVFVRVWTEDRDKTDSQILAKILYEVNCSASKIRSLAGVSYFSFNEYPNGRREKFKNLTSWNTPDSDFEFIIPDTIGESLAKTSCAL